MQFSTCMLQELRTGAHVLLQGNQRSTRFSQKRFFAHSSLIFVLTQAGLS